MKHEQKDAKYHTSEKDSQQPARRHQDTQLVRSDRDVPDRRLQDFVHRSTSHVTRKKLHNPARRHQGGN